MSRAGETYDNAFAKSFFSRYKAELPEGGAFRDVREAQLETCEYIERYYNPVRRHSALGYVSPLEYERAYDQRAPTQPLQTEPERSNELRESTVHEIVTTSVLLTSKYSFAGYTWRRLHKRGKIFECFNPHNCNEA